MTSSTNAHRNQKILFFKKPKSPSSSFDGAGPFFFLSFWGWADLSDENFWLAFFPTRLAVSRFLGKTTKKIHENFRF
jgi:hypothetical protein